MINESPHTLEYRQTPRSDLVSLLQLALYTVAIYSAAKALGAYGSLMFMGSTVRAFWRQIPTVVVIAEATVLANAVAATIATVACVRCARFQNSTKMLYWAAVAFLVFTLLEYFSSIALTHRQLQNNGNLGAMLTVEIYIRPLISVLGDLAPPAFLIILSKRPYLSEMCA